MTVLQVLQPGIRGRWETIIVAYNSPTNKRKSFHPGQPKPTCMCSKSVIKSHNAFSPSIIIKMSSNWAANLPVILDRNSNQGALLFHISICLIHLSENLMSFETSYIIISVFSRWLPMGIIKKKWNCFWVNCESITINPWIFHTNSSD